MLSDSRPVLSCLSVLSILSVTLVYCGQTVGWIKMKLCMMMTMMMSGFVERVIRRSESQTRCRSAKEVGLQMSKGKELRFAERLVNCSR